MRFHALVIAGIIISSNVYAQQFDGEWKGETRPTSECADAGSFTITIKNNVITSFFLTGQRGTSKNGQGKVENGVLSMAYGNNLRQKGELKFDGDTATGKIDSPCGMREMVGKKVK